MSVALSKFKYISCVQRMIFISFCFSFCSFRLLHCECETWNVSAKPEHTAGGIVFANKNHFEMATAKINPHNVMFISRLFSETFQFTIFNLEFKRKKSESRNEHIKKKRTIKNENWTRCGFRKRLYSAVSMSVNSRSSSSLTLEIHLFNLSKQIDEHQRGGVRLRLQWKLFMSFLAIPNMHRYTWFFFF